jgi:hypothetical protein
VVEAVVERKFNARIHSSGGEDSASLIARNVQLLDPTIRGAAVVHEPQQAAPTSCVDDFVARYLHHIPAATIGINLRGKSVVSEPSYNQPMTLITCRLLCNSAPDTTSPTYSPMNVSLASRSSVSTPTPLRPQSTTATDTTEPDWKRWFAHLLPHGQ